MPKIRKARAAGASLQDIGNMFWCTKQAVRHMLNSHPEIAHA